MQSSPLVSVLVTVFNRESFLADCLESILRSTWSDYEVVVVDDGSTDRSLEIADRFAKRDGRITVVRNPSNLGDYPNRTKAIQQSRGALIKFVDADDILYPHSLAIMVEAMKTHPDAGLALAHSLPEDEEPYPWCLEPQRAWRKHFLGRGCLGCGPSGAIIRRDRFEEIGGFGDWGVLNDTDLWLRMSARWPVVLLPPGLVWWRRHEGQEFTSGDAGRVYLERGYALAIAALNSTECPLAEDEKARAIRRVRQHHARRVLSLGLRGRQPVEAWRLFRRSGLGFADLASGLGGYK